MDSLDNYTNQGLLFSGDFISGGIFPKFSENLTLQESIGAFEILMNGKANDNEIYNFLNLNLDQEF